MKAVILAGGLGTRLSELTSHIPKPLTEINGMPILWHIMKIFSYYGINDFIILAGYKALKIKEFFSNYQLHSKSTIIETKHGLADIDVESIEDWRVHIVDTGLHTQTGGRIKRI